MSASFHAAIERFQNAIFSGESAMAADDILERGALTARQRIGLYIEGYRLRMLNVVRADYPALLEYFGVDRFDGLAADYVAQNPSTSFNLDRYGAGFAPWLSTHLTDAFAMDLARLESAIAVTFMGPESDPLEPTMLAEQTADAFGHLVLRPRAAACLLAFDFPIDGWLMEQRAGNHLPVPSEDQSFLFIYRHNNEVRRESLVVEEFLLLQNLFAGLPVAEAFDKVFSDPCVNQDLLAPNLQAWFSKWLSRGFFTTSNLRPFS